MIRFFVLIICLFALAVMVKAQVSSDKKQVSIPDSVKSPAADFEEWLRNEPMKTSLHDSSILQPIPPQLNNLSPKAMIPQQKPVQVVIMTPKLRQDMILCYQGHMLEERKKQFRQEGGVMTGSVNPLSLAALLISKLLPNRKSKKERQREKLQQILDNY
jgi:hypothetical protein